MSEETKENAKRTKAPKAEKMTVGEINDKVRKAACDRLLDEMRKGPGAWQKHHQGATLGRPVNLTTGVPYKGYNAILGGVFSPFQSKKYATYNQIQTIADQMRREGVAEDKLPHVRKGEKGTVFIHAKPVPFEKKTKDATGNETVEEASYWMYSQFVVFNAEQIENCPAGVKVRETEFQNVEEAELALQALKARTGLKIRHDQEDMNFYNLGTDEIHLVPKEAWPEESHYYGTALHEGIHSTLAAHRMNRIKDIDLRYDRNARSFEECVADSGSLFLAMDLGVQLSDEHFRNHAAYFDSWLPDFEKNPETLLRAISLGAKCADYILEETRQYKATLEEQKSKSAQQEKAPEAAIEAAPAVAPAAIAARAPKRALQAGRSM